MQNGAIEGYFGHPAAKADAAIAGAERLSNQVEPFKWLFLFGSGQTFLRSGSVAKQIKQDSRR